MTTSIPFTPNAQVNLVTYGQRLETVGCYAVRYSLVPILAWVGLMKLTTYEAEVISGLVVSSPFLAWLYSALSERAVASLLGTAELVTATLLVLHPVSTRLGVARGLLVATATFSLTLTFFFTTSGWEASLGGFPALSVLQGQFLLKNFLFLSASVFLLGGLLRLVRSHAPRQEARFT